MGPGPAVRAPERAVAGSPTTPSTRRSRSRRAVLLGARRAVPAVPVAARDGDGRALFVPVPVPVPVPAFIVVEVQPDHHGVVDEPVPLHERDVHRDGGFHLLRHRVLHAHVRL